MFHRKGLGGTKNNVQRASAGKGLYEERAVRGEVPDV